MTSRTRQKQELRARRLAEERAREEQARRRRRVKMLSGVVAVAAVVVGVAIAISVGGGAASVPKPASSAARQAATQVDGLLAGIPQSGNTLGSRRAQVTLTEFADLKCPVCRAFTLGAERQLISRDVRAGTVKIVYRSLCTATCNGPQPQVFTAQQAAALAAGLQDRAWHYIQLFYHLQGDETTSYVTPRFLEGLARLVPGLNYARWLSDRGSPHLASQVAGDQRAAQALGFNATPSVLVQGPGGTRKIAVLGDYGTYESAIKAVQ
ncbi:MAG: thioredoxin domain-containing protein [Solirubrobacteraceae bacterium]